MRLTFTCAIVDFPQAPDDGVLCPFMVASQCPPATTSCLEREVRRRMPMPLKRFPAMGLQLAGVSPEVARLVRGCLAP